MKKIISGTIEIVPLLRHCAPPYGQPDRKISVFFVDDFPNDTAAIDQTVTVKRLQIVQVYDEPDIWFCFCFLPLIPQPVDRIKNSINPCHAFQIYILPIKSLISIKSDWIKKQT